MLQRGDIVKVDLNPVNGHEQGNFRPVLVLNSLPMPGGLNLVVPITTKPKTYPLEVLLDQRTRTTGCVLCFQLHEKQNSSKKCQTIYWSSVWIIVADFLNRQTNRA